MNGKDRTLLAVVQNDVSHIKDKVNKLCDSITDITKLFTEGEQKIALNREAIKELDKTETETRNIMWKVLGGILIIVAAVIGILK